MGDGGTSQPWRYLAFVVVVALHLLLVAILTAESRARLLSPIPETVNTTLASLPQPTAPLPVGPAPELHLTPVVPLSPVVSPPPLITYPSADDTPTVDWRAEAQKAAAAVTGSIRTPPETADRRKTASSHGPRPWVPPPAHHAGEEYRTETGDSIVWISDKCYVKSSAPMLGMPDILARSMLSKTFCPSDSGPARGDLFEALPAYKKYHPDADPPK